MRDCYRRLVSVAVLCLALLAPAGVARAACIGDCNGNGVVTIGELVYGVNAALGLTTVAEIPCEPLDRNGDGVVSIDELVAAVNSSVLSCPIFPADYRSKFAQVRSCRFSTSHGGVMIRVFASCEAVTPYLNEDSPLPVGSVIVKEEFDGNDCSNDDELVRWRAMSKQPAGFDPDDGDWHWQWVDANDTVRYDDKFTCISCHNAPECLARDHQCTVDEEPPRGKLGIVLENEPGALLSVSGASPSDVYAVGADPGDGKGPLVMHYDGTTWERLETGATGDLWWISVVPIDGAFYMAGDGGLILKYDLTSKEFTRFDTPGDAILFGIWGTAADNLWAVGDDKVSGGAIWHYDGSTWSVFDTSATLPDGFLPLNKVWGRSADEIYAVGDQGTVLFFDGTGWTKIDGDTKRPLFTVHGNDSIVDAVGGFLTDSALIERSGDAFMDQTPACAPQLNGVFVPPDGRAVAVGHELAVAVREDDGWHFQFSTPGDVRDFHSTWVDSEGGIWAVGGDLVDLVNGVLAYGGPRTINKPAVSYKNDIVPLLADQRCTSEVCHGGFFPASGYDLSTYESSFVAGVEADAFGILPIVAGDPDSSYLIEKISTDMPRNGVRMPNGFPPLSEAEIDLIRTWISQGAQNN